MKSQKPLTEKFLFWMKEKKDWVGGIKPYNTLTSFSLLIGAIMPAVFAFSNYFTYLPTEDKVRSKEGFLFLLVSIIYASFSIYLILKNVYKR